MPINANPQALRPRSAGLRPSVRAFARIGVSASPVRTRLLLLWLVLGVPTAVATSLSDAVDLAMDRAGEARFNNRQSDTPSKPINNPWLAGDPSIEAMYVDSQPSQGTDELEVALNLPIKGTAQRAADRAVIALEETMDSTAATLRRLYYADEVRERAWAMKIAVIQRDFARQRLHLVQSLLEKATELVRSQAIDRYQYLLIEQLYLDNQVAATAADHRSANAREAFTWLTGLTALPEPLIEPNDLATPAFSNHPLIRQLDVAEAQQQALAKSAEPARTNWNLALIARRFENPMITERQYGLAFQAPLTLFGTENVSNQVGLRQQERDFQIARDQQLLSLQGQWVELSRERAALLQEREATAAALRIAEQLEQQVNTLSASNELEAEVLLNRKMDLQRRRERFALLDALLGQNTARLHQISGDYL